MSMKRCQVQSRKVTSYARAHVIALGGKCNFPSEISKPGWHQFVIAFALFCSARCRERDECRQEIKGCELYLLYDAPLPNVWRTSSECLTKEIQFNLGMKWCVYNITVARMTNNCQLMWVHNFRPRRAVISNTNRSGRGSVEWTDEAARSPPRRRSDCSDNFWSIRSQRSLSAAPRERRKDGRRKGGRSTSQPVSQPGNRSSSAEPQTQTHNCAKFAS